MALLTALKSAESFFSFRRILKFHLKRVLVPPNNRFCVLDQRGALIAEPLQQHTRCVRGNVQQRALVRPGMTGRSVSLARSAWKP